MAFFQFVRDQRRTLPIAVSEKTCLDRIYIVTGGNTGLGLEAARHLTSCKPKKVILAVRNEDAGKAAIRDIESTTGVRNVLEVWHLDLASYDSVKAFAKRATEQLDRIDAIIENAGVAFDTFQTVEDNKEKTLVVNVFSTFLLAVLLYPKLQATARNCNVQSHIVIVSSEVGFFPPAKAEMQSMKQDPMRYLNDEKKAKMNARYPTSKLLQILSTRQLASQLPIQNGVVLNYLNPGMCKTGLSRNVSIVMRIVIRVMNLLFGRTAEEGSRNLIYATRAGESSHGCYISNCEVEEHRIPSWVTDNEGQTFQHRLWDDVAKELDAIEPGCVQKILS